jgi:dipeptidase
VYWFYVDNPYVSTYVPIYAGVTAVSPYYQTYDYNRFSEESMRWAVDFVEKLMLLRWQSAVKDLQEVRQPMEAEFFNGQAEVELKALGLLKQSPAKGRQFLTDLTVSRMNRIMALYRELRLKLLTKYGGDSF